LLTISGCNALHPFDLHRHVPSADIRGREREQSALIMLYVFENGVSPQRIGRQVEIRGLEPEVVHRLRGRAARYVRRIMFDRAAHLPDNGTTWELLSIGIITADPNATPRMLTRRRLGVVAGMIAVILGSAALVLITGDSDPVDDADTPCCLVVE
jgi:hypothetical protein